MNEIIFKRILNDSVTLMKIKAPLISKKAKPGQFIILRVNDDGERIPLTIADSDSEEGSVTIIFQKVGKTTMELDSLNVGDSILDLVGPLGNATELEEYKKVAVIGGGVGTAIAYPEAKSLYKLGADVDVIVGFRNKDLIILEDEMEAVSSRLFIMTDDGSNGHKGFVTDALQDLLDSGEKYDLVIAIGPLVMMRAVSALTKKHGIKTIISMNSIMIDGTGMCGGCRLTVNGETKFACIDGPDFDGHQVDYDEALRRSAMFRVREERSCNLYRGIEDEK